MNFTNLKPILNTLNKVFVSPFYKLSKLAEKKINNCGNTQIYKVGIILIYSVLLAAFFDIIEIALIQLLLGNLIQIWSSITYYFAVSKFSL